MGAGSAVGAVDAVPACRATAAAVAPPHIELNVGAESDVRGVVAAAARFCIANGLSPLLAAHVATAASELANNLWMHADRGGQIGLARLEGGAGRGSGVELVAEDTGPGIADLALAMTDGWSSGGGMGCGLPGVRRLMDEFRIDSAPGHGTRVVARKWQRR